MGFKAVDNASHLVALMAENLIDERRFPKRYRFVFSAALRDSVFAINRFCQMAYSYYPKDPYLCAMRLSCIDQAKAECENLNSLLKVGSEEGKGGTAFLQLEPMRDFVSAAEEEKKLLGGWRNDTERLLNSLPDGGVGKVVLCISPNPDNSCLAYNVNTDGNVNANLARGGSGAVPD